jgi:hypothetical protein
MKQITCYSWLTRKQILPLWTTELKSSKSYKKLPQYKNYTLQPQSTIQNNELHWEAWSKNKDGGMFLEK